MGYDLKIDFDKSADGLVPAVVQDADTRQVLMLGYMNAAAYAETLRTGCVTFHSRSKGRLWTKGETTGHYLRLVDVKVDCDNDTLLVRARPEGPTCHTGTDTCWAEENSGHYGFLSELEELLVQRMADVNTEDESYTKKLLRKGLPKIAQKVGEEGVELTIEAVLQHGGKGNRTEFLGEAADLMFHYLLLLRAAGYSLEEVVEVLRARHRK